MRIWTVLTAVGILALSGSGFAQVYPEVEPNNTFPGTLLAGDPTIKSGAVIVGQIMPANDLDYFQIKTRAVAAPGIYRYRFDVACNNGDAQLDVYDALSQSNMLAANDDYLNRGFEPVCIFDMLEPAPQIRTWNLFLRHFNSGTIPSYLLTITFDPITPYSFGILSGGTTSTVVSNPAGGLPNWLTFTLAQESDVTIDTIGAINGADTELALMNAQGQTVAANDDMDRDLGVYTSKIVTHLVPGTYYIAASRYNMSCNWNESTNTTLGWDRSGAGFLGDVQTSTGFFPVRIKVDSTELVPQSYSVLKGFEFSGSLQSFFASDDNSLVAFPEDDLTCTIECFADGAYSTARELRLYVEASAGRLGLTQSIQMFNFDTNRWDEVDGRLAPTEDVQIEISLTTSANAHLGDSGEVFARVAWSPVNDEDPALDGWEHRIDLLKWIVVP